MNITPIFSMTRSGKGSRIIVNYNKNVIVIEPTDPNYSNAVSIYNHMRLIPEASRAAEVASAPKSYAPAWLIGVEETPAAEGSAQEAPVERSKDDILREGLSNLINFFSEFDFTPSYRFTNTLAYKVNQSRAAAQDYVSKYFSLTSSSYTDEITEKVKSKEFSGILKNIAQYGKPTAKVNNRIKVYYGAAGTGKTTAAWAESEGRCVQCNASMLPSDLMENFIFKDGKPDFDKSILWECMEQGKPILLDEINLLPFDSLRFLQGIVDGKTSFIYKNREVTIKDGFEIIGTMNLTLGGITYGLPEPLVDRCEDIKEFVLSAEQLMGAVTGNFIAG
ncbi:MAG: AAA family ATPase [Bacillota bacterium]|nr:AAA family ATPase [Bacillota bacterium]